jgi:hypothetical protein
MTRYAAGLVLLVVAGCSTPVQQAPVQATPEPAAPAQQAFDPVGVYDFRTDVDGMAILGTLALRRDEQGQLQGTLSTDVTGGLALTSVTVEGRRALLRAPTPEGELYMQIDFAADDRITGGWELSTGPSGTVTGQRRRPPGN